MIRNVAVFITVALALGACAMSSPRGPDEGVSEGWSELGAVSQLPAARPAGPGEITNGHIAGTLGPYLNFSEAAYRQTLLSEAYHGEVTLDAGRGYWVMTRLDIEGGLAHPALVPGATFEQASGTYAAGGELFFSVQGCAGPTEGVFDFDESAESVTVQVEAGPTPNQRVLTFTAVFPGGATVDGSFGYTAP